MEFWTEYGLFLAKAVTAVAAILLVLAMGTALVARDRGRHRDRLEVQSLNRHYEDLRLALQAEVMRPPAFKRMLRSLKKRRKAERRDGGTAERRVFVLDFEGDLRASAVASIREEITALLTIAEPSDEVLLRLESAGGMIPHYGLAASELARVRSRGVRLTVAVDKIAASGGYMMACVADHIIAAPFAAIGSIGVVSQMPNFHRFLQRHDIDYEQYTAGEFKRTVTLFGENTDKDRQKFREEIEDAHVLFKDFVQEHRPGLDMAAVATGEFWYGTRALQRGLVDELRTSDDYLLAASESAQLYALRYEVRKPFLARVSERLEAAIRWRRGGLPLLEHRQG